MYGIALVEDELDAADALAGFIGRYGTERGEQFGITRFTNAIDFELSRLHFDLVFMDIQMPGIDGMEAAHLLRAHDETTPLIFVTNLAQYAIKGYEVNALDFIVKPVTYHNFRMRMDKAMRHLRRYSSRSVTVSTRDGMRVLPLSDIEYVEVNRHYLSYHLCDEEEPFVVYGSLAAFEEEVGDGPFVRISASCLVNVNHVRSAHGSGLVTRGGTTLYFSRSRKREALLAITRLLGGSV